MDFGSPVAQEVNTPNGLQTLSQLMSLKQQQQQLQIGQSNILTAQSEAQGQQQLMQTRQRMQQATQSGVDDQGNSLYTPGTTDLDPGKVAAMAMRTDPVYGPQIAQGVIQTHTDKVALQSAMLGLNLKERQAVMGPMEAFALNPDADHLAAAQSSLSQFVQDNPQMKDIAGSANRLLMLASQNKDPKARAMMANSFAAMMQGGEAVQTQPQQAQVSTGQQTLIGTTTPAVAGGQFTPATGIQQYPSPSTPTVTAAGAPAVLGAQPGMGTGTVQTALTPTQQGVAQDVNTDYATTVTDARKAAQDIGVLQNIMRYASGAVTGVGSDRRSYIAGLAGLVGMTPEQMAKTNTDLLAKNSNMLALAGGDTNLAKTLAESANPNLHMTPQAIEEAAQQVIAQKQMSVEKMHYMSQYTGDYNAYQKALTEWNANADPRVLQLPNMTQAERKSMAAAMSPEERKEFQGKIRYFQGLGILK